MGGSSPSPSFQYPVGPGYWVAAANPPRPTAAFVLSLIGGFFIFFGGIGEYLLATALVPFIAGPIGLFAIFGLGAVAIGIAVIVLAAMLYSHPKDHVILGVSILVLSIASLIGSGGGFFGLLFGVIGGALGIAFSPSPSLPFPAFWAPVYGAPPPGSPPLLLAQSPPSRSMADSVVGSPCPRCSRGTGVGAKFCPSCGTALS